MARKRKTVNSINQSHQSVSKHAKRTTESTNKDEKKKPRKRQRTENTRTEKKAVEEVKSQTQVKYKSEIKVEAKTADVCDKESDEIDLEVTPTCIICLDTEESSEIKILPCMHKFHYLCINKWLLYSFCCPICRSQPFYLYTIPLDTLTVLDF